MLNPVKLEQVSNDDRDLHEALAAAHLPIDDIREEGRTFYRAVSGSAELVGFAGIEECGTDFLLRSIVVLPSHRGQRVGHAIVEQTLRDLNGNGDIYLATTTAALFFSTIGFVEIPRESIPPGLLATRQLSSICPSSATIMKLNRPPT